jgi:heat shock protein HslJ
MKIKLSLIACLMITATACSSLKKTNTVNFADSRINNIAWAITSFRGKALNEQNFPNGMPTIIFNMQSGRISGYDGCNSFMGLATYTATTIKPGPTASTKIACTNSTFPADLYDVLSATKITYHLTDDILRLYVNDAEVMALKEKQ